MAKLYPEDQKRVDDYLASSYNDVERKPFKPLLLLSIIFGALVLLTVISYALAKSHGVV